MSRELVRAERRAKITFELIRLSDVYQIANKICSLDNDLRITCILDIECIVSNHSVKTIVSQSPWMEGVEMGKLYKILKSKGFA